MKVKFKYGIRTYSGTIDEMTYGSYRKGKVCIGRQWVLPKPTEQNTEIGAVATNLSDLWAAASVDYKADFKTYATRNTAENVPGYLLGPTGYALFMKAMWAWAEDESPAVDLKTVTIEDIGTLGGKVASVSDCVTNGYLARVSDYGDLDSPI